MRVFDLAKELEMTSKALLGGLKKLGIPATNHMSALSDAEVAKVWETLGKGVSKASQDKKEKKEKKTKAGIAEKKTQTAKGAKKKKSSLATKEPPAPKKKSRILIKKKPQPSEIQAPISSSEKPGDHEALIGDLLVKPEKEIDLSPPAGEKTGLVSPKAEKDLEGAPSSVQSPDTSVSIEEPPREETRTQEVGGDVSTELKEVEVKEREEKPKRTELGQKEKLELLKADLTDLSKKQADSHLDKRGKKAKKPREEAAREGYHEIRRWQTFKPLHKKTGRGKDAERAGGTTSVTDITKPRIKVIKLAKGVTIKDFSEIIGQKSTEIIKKLMEMGIMATMNQAIDMDAAVLISSSYGLNAEVVEEEAVEDLLVREEDSPDSLVPRWPVVTIMGHVDHGKTSLLDAIRESKVTDSEAGGITQHIGAYSVDVGEKNIVFLDTPGHKAFTAMRARGANITDIVILVVAADDGVMPQTLEAIHHSKAANVPIIVAINKIDKPDANPERIRNMLSEHGLIPEEWGGQTIFAEVSAKSQKGLDHLLEMVLLQADVLELKSNPNREARGTIVEAKLDKGRGPVATVLVQEGTLRVGEAFVTGSCYGKVRALINDQGEKVHEVPPSTPIEVIGLTGVPMGGDTFVVVENDKIARDIANTRMQRQRNAELSKFKRVTLDDLYSQIKEGDIKELNIVVKADVQGSVEAVVESLEKLSTQTVNLRTIHDGVGGITETDILLAAASNAIIIGFNIRPEPKVVNLAEKEKVDIRLYTVIYDAINDVKAAMEGLLEPTYKEETLGRLEVREVFMISNVGVIAGSYVLDGVISRNSSGARIIRDNVPIYDGKISSLKRFKEDTREVQTGYECGIGIENYNDIKVGDIIEVYSLKEVATKL